MKNRIKILFLFFFLSSHLQAQVLKSSASFSAGTSWLEPDGRKEAVKISEEEFVVLSKVKGNMVGESQYSLEKYDASLSNGFKTPVSIPEHEDVKQLHFNGKEIILFTVIHNQESGESKLQAYGFDLASGKKNWDKTLMSMQVGAYQSARNKGGVEETFENAIASGLSKDYIVPFEYQYELSFSPDGNKLLVYCFDYTKPNLIASACIYDKEFNKVMEGMVPIDNNFINYGIFLNDRGDVYILNVDKLGRIVVIQYNMDTKDGKLLDIQYASTQRESLRFHIHKDDEVYVGSVNTAGGKMRGVMYSKFNFEKNLVEKINFHDLSDGLVQTADALRSGKNFRSENWEHFEMTHFVVNRYEKVLMVLEKREIFNTPEYMYKTEAILEPERWKERMAKINAEALVMVSFNANDDLMWENYYFKSQVVDLASGLTNASFLMNVNDEAIGMIYGSADSPSGIMNTYNYVEWNSLNGNKVKELPLQNDDKLCLVRNYSLCWDDKVVLVGRKGLLGKKYTMSSYKLGAGN